HAALPIYKRARPHKRLSINVHLDGMRATHDHITDRPGTFDRAIAMIQEGKRRGYSVGTNTTVFRETSMDEIEEMRDFSSVVRRALPSSPGDVRPRDRDDRGRQAARLQRVHQHDRVARDVDGRDRGDVRL